MNIKLKKEKLVKCIKMETFKYGHLKDFKLFIYKNIIDGTEHIALLKGKVLSNQNILVRMHSLNIFSDVLDPDNKILSKSFEVISKQQNGIIVLIRNPRKELNSKNKNYNSKKKKYFKRIWYRSSNFNRFRSKKNYYFNNILKENYRS